MADADPCGTTRLAGRGANRTAPGHFRNGILLGPVTGELMADAVMGRPPAALTPFDPARFDKR